MIRLQSLFAAALLSVLGATGAAAQAPPPAPTTNVLAILTVKADVPRPELTKLLPEEVRATVRLYLDGKIVQWYGRADGKGVMFILNASSVDEAKQLVANLPLDKAGLATFEFMALTPLSPLRVLLTPQ
jgi:hypothetical protein